MNTPDYPINTGCVMIMNGDGFDNFTYSFLPVGTVKNEQSGYYHVIPLAPLEGGGFDFIDEETRNKFLEELERIRETLNECNLSEEYVPVQMF
jgi:hypothetical protein